MGQRTLAAYLCTRIPLTGGIPEEAGLARPSAPRDQNPKARNQERTRPRTIPQLAPHPDPKLFT